MRGLPGRHACESDYSAKRTGVAMKILCLSSGMLAPKKADTPVARMHLYLNYGLLGLASILRRAGFSPYVVHGRFDEPEGVVRRTLSYADPGVPVLLSVPSSFALPWARRACAAIRRISPSRRIVVGGRWVVADDHAWIRSQLPDANEVVSGLAETQIVGIAARPGEAMKHPAPARFEMPELDYRLLENWLDFHPSIEVSRGCGMGCTFCAEADEPISGMKEPSLVAGEFLRLARLYDSEEVHPYLEASFFRPSTTWISSFRAALADRGVRLQWRAETRVDGLSPDQVHALAETGLRVLDLGLESASPIQLQRMQKTRRGDVYLRRASELLHACRDAGVWTKVNVLLHPGETPETLAETERWLEAHRDSIKGLSVGPTILFRFGRASSALLANFEKLGASVVDSGSLDGRGYAHLHLSPEMTHELAEAECLRIARSFMSSRDYFDLKSFSYLPRSLKWLDFERQVQTIGAANLPFHLPVTRLRSESLEQSPAA